MTSIAGGSGTPTLAEYEPGVEFDRQVLRLIDLGYPSLAGLDPGAFVDLVAPLRAVAVGRAGSLPAPSAGQVPFLLVVTRAVAPIERTMPLTALAGKNRPGLIDRLYEPGALERFVATEAAQPPDERAYLLLDVHRGEEFCGVVPADAMATITDRGRTLLTIEEGIALVTLHPELLAKNKCFSLGGSRSGDKRVPAIWISQNAPKLGWCWQGNPHTWLGMASAATRLAGTGS